MALALGSPAGNGQGVGYAVSVGPGTARLTARLSTGRPDGHVDFRVTLYDGRPVYLTALIRQDPQGRTSA